jgi:peptidoglycan/LPS O-acetylase OafA/YrhL
VPPELNALRGFAAFAVMLFHYTSRYGQLYGYNDLLPFHMSWGQYGVQLFFLISGFVIFMTLGRTRQPINFVVGRFSRLYPTYWAGVIATFTIVAVMGLPGRETSFIVPRRPGRCCNAWSPASMMWTGFTGRSSSR